MPALRTKVLRKLPSVACLLLVSGFVTGCSPEQPEAPVPNFHDISLGNNGPFVTTIPADIRHRSRPNRAPVAHHRAHL